MLMLVLSLNHGNDIIVLQAQPNRRQTKMVFAYFIDIVIIIVQLL